MRVAWLTGATYRGRPMPPGQLPPFDTEERALVDVAAQGRNITLETRQWSDDPASFAGLDAVLIRSCWDYVEHCAAFCDALDAIDTHAPVLNPPALVRWNARKSYLAAFEAAGIPIVPTVWADTADVRSVAQAFDRFEAAELVVKPATGAGGRNTLRLARNRWSEADLMDGLRGPSLIQPFQAAVQDEGEFSFLFVGGTLAATILKQPAPGGWLTPASQGAVNRAVTPRDDDRQAACAAFEALGTIRPEPALYARIDMVRDARGRLVLMEAELIEPFLYVALAPQTAEALATALRAGV
jgi:glutathione synthase/RimK-type ligase-like ATP-grasp enzyme